MIIVAPTRSARRASSGALRDVFVPAEAHLDGHRNRHRLDDRRDETRRVVEIAHQRAPASCAGDAPGGTAHVDVDELGPRRLDAARRFRHRAGVAADELDRVGVTPSPSARSSPRASPSRKRLAATISENDQRRAEAARHCEQVNKRTFSLDFLVDRFNIVLHSTSKHE